MPSWHIIEADVTYYRTSALRLLGRSATGRTHTTAASRLLCGCARHFVPRISTLRADRSILISNPRAYGPQRLRLLGRSATGRTHTTAASRLLCGCARHFVPGVSTLRADRSILIINPRAYGPRRFHMLGRSALRASIIDASRRVE